MTARRGFKEGEDRREREKRQRLEGAIAAAMGRKKFMPALADGDIPEFRAFGRTVVSGRQGEGAGLSIPTGK